MPEEKKPVIIYGGSFDPPHRGHLALAAAALRFIRPGKFYFVPGFLTPFKDFRPVPYASRAAMLRAALRDSGLSRRRELRISPFEASSGRVVYTYETVEYFRRRHPGAPLYFLMGSDCLAGFRGWKKPERVLCGARLLVGARPGSPLKPGGVPFTLLPGTFPDADSTRLRRELFLGRRPAELHGPVCSFIERRSVYLEKERRALRKLISPARYGHTLHTAELALALAPLSGMQERQTALAALLHDCARDLPAYAQRRLCGPRRPETRPPADESPALLHAPAGAELARKKFGVRDPEVLEAIRTHTCGAPGMGRLARLIYVSDAANQGRTHPEAALIRKLAFLDLDAAFRAANYVKLVYAFSAGGWVHPLSVQLWNSLQSQKKE